MITWTHYEDGSRSAVTEQAVYTISPPDCLGKFSLVILPAGGSFPDRYVYRLRSVEALVTLAESYENDYHSPGAVLDSGESNTQPNQTERDQTK